MRQVKVISASGEGQLESWINEWLYENDHFNVIDIQFQLPNLSHQYYVAMIVYETATKGE